MRESLSAWKDLRLCCCLELLLHDGEEAVGLLVDILVELLDFLVGGDLRTDLLGGLLHSLFDGLNWALAILPLIENPQS